MKQRVEFSFRVVTPLGEDNPRLQFIEPTTASLKCPFCEIFSRTEVITFAYRSEFKYQEVHQNQDKITEINHSFNHICFPFDCICDCLNCRQGVFVKVQAKVQKEDFINLSFNSYLGEILEVFPKLENSKKSPVIPFEVPERYSRYFLEALQIIDISPTASAALSRRILQNILRDEFDLGEYSLAKEIEDFVALSGIPSYLSDAVDAIRNIGNFAAHPLKDKSTGEVAEVEPGEAEWLIEVLNTLFDFTFVQPKRLEERRKQLNQKLESLGKPPMKSGLHKRGVEENPIDS